MLRHVTLLENKGLVAAIAFIADDTHALVGNYTEGKSNTYLENFPPTEAGTLQIGEAKKIYKAAIEVSKERGCKIIYQGLPNFG
jgi:hypothetical protein